MGFKPEKQIWRRRLLDKLSISKSSVLSSLSSQPQEKKEKKKKKKKTHPELLNCTLHYENIAILLTHPTTFYFGALCIKYVC